MRLAFTYLSLGLILLIVSIVFMILKVPITGHVISPAAASSVSTISLSLGLISLLIARGELKKHIKKYGKDSVSKLIQDEVRIEVLKRRLEDEKTDVIINAAIKVMLDGVIEKNYKKMEIINNLRGLIEDKIKKEKEVVILNNVLRIFGRTIELVKNIDYFPKRNLTTIQSLYLISKNCLSKKLVP